MRKRWDGRVKVVAEKANSVFLEVEGKRLGGILRMGRSTARPGGAGWEEWEL